MCCHLPHVSLARDGTSKRVHLFVGIRSISECGILISVFQRDLLALGTTVGLAGAGMAGMVRFLAVDNALYKPLT